MLRTEKRMRLCITLLTLALVFIWGNSLLPGDFSGALSDWVKGVLKSLFPAEEGNDSGGFLLRKLAHFTEFAALGMCLDWLFAMMKKGKLLPLCLGVGAACVDETIQCFVPGRGPGVRDVCIDSMGVLFGLLLLEVLHWLFLKHVHHSEETKK